MEFMQMLLDCLKLIATPTGLLYVVVGTLAGVVLGAIPGLGSSTLMVVLLPISYKMDITLAMALFISVIVTLVTVLTGFLEVDLEKLVLLRSFGASKYQLLTMAVIPGSVPVLVSALKLNISMTWVGVIVGEFLVSRAGLGYLIVYGGQVFKLDLVMAGTAVLCVLAALMYLGVALCEKKLRVRHA